MTLHSQSHNRRPYVAALILILLTLSGCGYLGYYTRQAHYRQTFDTMPSLSALNKLAPEDSLVVTGSITRLQPRQEPLMLVAVSSKYRQNEKVAVVQLQRSAADEYMAFLPRGEYELHIFADLDQNGDFEWNELVGRASASLDPALSKGGIVVTGPTITVDFDQPGKVDFRLSETVRPSSYVYASLSDEFFDPKYGSLGLYNQSELISHNQGFLFGLEDYDEDKTTVVFVHGIAGTPRDWKFFVEGLDRSRFQPFFFYYPTGLPLDKMGALLAQLIQTLDKSAKNGNRKIVLAAHSMGGLVALSAIDHLAVDGLPASLKMYCSFSTPYAGDENARMGSETAPVVVPVWRDIAADSTFLRDLMKRPFPGTLPYYLYFSYLDETKFKLGESSDGSVILRSQLADPMQAAATKVIGFNATHIGILNSEPARASFLRLLDSASPPRRAGQNGNEGH